MIFDCSYAFVAICDALSITAHSQQLPRPRRHLAAPRGRATSRACLREQPLRETQDRQVGETQHSMVHKFTAALAAGALAIATIALPATSAQAEGTGDPVISAPQAGSSVTSGWTGPITVDFSNAPVDTYDADLSCGTSYKWHTFQYAGTTEDALQTWVLGSALTGPKDCELDVLGENSGAEAISDFTVQPPPLVVDEALVSPTSFYGYPDTTTMSYRLNSTATVTARVYNSGGGVVRKTLLGTKYAGRHSWKWNGKRNDGTKVDPGKFRINITAVADRTRSVNGWVTVAVRPLVLDNASVSRSTFYPLVRDGYRDTTTMHYRLNRAASITVQVRNSAGRVVRRAGLGIRSGGRHLWAWNGRKNDGTKVGTGTYRIQITADADGLRRSVTEKVTVATGWRTKTVTKSRGGYYTSGTSHSSSCYVDFDDYDETTDLDCWGGSHAQADYGFSIPANAYNLGWSVSGYKGCCSDGTTSKWSTRTSSTSYRVSVKVTGWHDYTITAVRLTYTYKRRI
jgi:flagellar hook assembly protein FlgD